MAAVSHVDATAFALGDEELRQAVADLHEGDVDGRGGLGTDVELLGRRLVRAMRCHESAACAEQQHSGEVQSAAGRAEGHGR